MSKTWIQDVVGAHAEYFSKSATTIASQGEYVEFEFNKDINLEEIVATSTGSSLDTYKVSIVYPSSETEMEIATDIPGNLNFTLNEYNSGKTWYRVPTSGKLRVTCTGWDATFDLSLFAIGRPG